MILLTSGNTSLKILASCLLSLSKILLPFNIWWYIHFTWCDWKLLLIFLHSLFSGNPSWLHLYPVFANHCKVSRISVLSVLLSNYQFLSVWLTPSSTLAPKTLLLHWCLKSTNAMTCPLNHMINYYYFFFECISPPFSISWRFVHIWQNPTCT